MSDRPGQHAKPDDALTARLVSRLTEPVGLIDTRQPEQKYSRTADWLAERFSLAGRLSNRYATEDQSTSAAQTYVLGRPLQPQFSSFAGESLSAGSLSLDQPEFSMAGPRHYASESSPSSGEKLRVSRRSPQIALKSDMAPSRGTSSTGAASKPKQAAPAASDETRLQRSSSAAQLVARSLEAPPPLILSGATFEGVHAEIERSSKDTDDPPARSVGTESTRTTPLAQGMPSDPHAIRGAPETTRASNDYSEPQPSIIRSNQSDDSRAGKKSPARARSKATSDQRPLTIQRRRKSSPDSQEVEGREPALTAIQLDRQSPGVSPPALPLAISRSSPTQRKKKNEQSNTQKQRAAPGVQTSSSKETPANPASTGERESLVSPAQSSHDSVLRPPLPLPLPELPESPGSRVQRKKQDERADESRLEPESLADGDSGAGWPESQPHLRSLPRVESSSIGPAARQEELPLARKPEESLAASKPLPPREGMFGTRGLSLIEPSNIITTKSEKPAVMPRENPRRESPAESQPLLLSASGGLPVQRKKQEERSRISRAQSDSPISPDSNSSRLDLPASDQRELPGNDNAGARALVAAEIRDNSGSLPEPSIIWRKTTGSRPAVEAGLNITGSPARLERQTENSISSSTAEPRSALPAAAPAAIEPPQAGRVDLERITQQVLRDIARRLEVERERRGLGRWA